MIALRWATFLLAVLGLVIAGSGVRDWFLFAFLAATILTHVVTYVGLPARRRHLVQAMPEGHPQEHGFLDALEQEGHR